MIRRSVAAPALGRKHGALYNIKKYRTLILMCAPAILYFLVFHYLPMPGAYIAFTNYNYAKGIFGSDYVGMENFRFLYQTGKLWLLTKNTLLYNVTFILLGNLINLTVAILLNEVRSKHFRKVSQSIMFLPYFISHVLVGLMVFNILSSDYGFLNGIIKSMGGTAQNWYAASKKGIWPVFIVLVHIWKETGYGSIVYFAAITGIDTDMIEAAQVDGVNAFQKIRYIILPSLKPTVIILILFAMGNIMKGSFGLFWNLIGSNSLLYKTTDIIDTFVYRSLRQQANYAQSGAAGLYQSVFGFATVMIFNAIVKKIEPDYSLF